MKSPSLQRQHRLLGTILLLPFIAWSLTGIFFLVRPGYEEAYERIPVWTYPIEDSLEFSSQSDWHEIRYFQSVLGQHLIVRDGTGWKHLRAETLEEWSLPDERELMRLLEDAFRFNPGRYGNIVSIDENIADTDTGAVVTVSWTTLSITQNGRDSRWIDRIYSIHYLQWTGFYWPDRILGLGGLALLIYMTVTGWKMITLASRSKTTNN